MEPYEIIAQLIGIVAMAMNVLSFQQKTRMGIIRWQLLGTMLFAVNMFMLGAIVGGCLNLLGAARAVVFSNKERFHTEKVAWVYVFSAAYLVSYLLTFILVGKEPTPANLVVEFLPIIGMIFGTVSFYLDDPKIIRKLGLVNSPAWLIYNSYNKAIGGILCEILCLISIVVGILRLDRKRKG